MKNYDPKVAQQVWDRVQNANPAPDSQALIKLIEEELLDAATYQKLSRRLPPPQAAIARQLAAQEQAHAICLKGIYTMLSGEKPGFSPPAVADEPPDLTLRRCYGREMRCLAQYEARRGDPLYGHIFRSLAKEEQAHCHRLLELLGAITK